jgi:hypothetical protein
MSTLAIETTNTKSKKPKVSKKKKTDTVVSTESSVNESISLKEEPAKKETLTETISNVKVEEVETDKNKSSELSESEEKSIDTLLEKYGELIKTLEFISKESLKDYNVSKESINQVTKSVNKSIKLFGAVQISNNDFMTKETSESLKAKDAKSKKPKKNVDKSSYAINKECETYKEVLSFMNLPENTLVSRSQLIKEINAFVKKEKDAKNPDIFVEENIEEHTRRFKLIGNLKVFFDFIKKQMIERGDLSKTDTFPNQIRYQDIMKYLSYCFPETEKSKAKKTQK